MEARLCAQCGAPFVAKRPSARYCGGSCRMAASRARGTVVDFPRGEAKRPAVGVLTATTKVLTEAGREETPAGASALVLAGLMDDPMTAPAAKATIAKQLSATLAEALKGAAVQSKPDELRERRERLRSG